VLLTSTRTGAAGLLLVAFAAGGSSAPVPIERAKAEKELAALAEKLTGSWRGGDCVGTITFRADRTYEWTGIGPGGDRDSGAWSLRGDPAEPVLVMECKKSDAEDRRGKTTERTVVRVDAEEFEFKHADGTAARVFDRVKPEIGARPAREPEE
jgi:hypothetical protein